MVEGSAAAAKVVFLVAPSATVKPSTLAKAGNGAMIQGREGDVSVIQVDKRADFATVLNMIQMLTQRLSEAFLILNVRDSERTTAEEIRMTQQELNEQLGGIYGNLSAELLRPYIEWKLFTMQRDKLFPRLPQGVVMNVIAGLEGVGRGQDREALMMFMTTLQQTLPPEMVMQLINPEEAIKRLAASMGIETLNLIRSEEERAQDAQQVQQQQMTQGLMGQLGQLSKAPMVDPSKNPEVTEALRNAIQPQQETPAAPA
jgi:Bacteriophage head to tail connecting protein